MNAQTKVPATNRRLAFTLIELLVVIAIIGILAAMLMPVLSKVKVKGQIAKAQMEIGQIKSAIQAYESDYSRYPVSSNTMSKALRGIAETGTLDDFTFGTYNLAPLKTPTSTYSVMATPSKGYQANNSEVMAVLLDKETLPLNGAQTINYRHLKNPQQRPYLSASMMSDTNSPGIGADLVYRDPWGNPYIISLDVNYDEKTRDSFYGLSAVSRKDKAVGYHGLFNSRNASGASDDFEATDRVLIWSAGPDKMVDSGVAANKGANKDNVMSIRQ